MRLTNLYILYIYNCNMFLGPWVFPAMIFLFIANVIVVMLVVREFCQKTRVRTLTENQGEKTKMVSKQFYELKAALASLWLPAVVGDKKNLFLAASLSTLITKILMLLVSVILAYFFQEQMHPHPFIFWSRVGKMFNFSL